MPSLKTIRESSLSDLSLAILNIHGIASDGDTIGAAGIRDSIGATDNRLIEGAFLWVKSPQSVAFAQACTLGAAISSATATSITLTQTPTTDPVRVGDYVLCESEVMRVTALSILSTTSATATVVRGCLGTTAATHADTTAVTKYLYGQWRAISSHSFSTDLIELVRGLVPSGTFTNRLLYDILFILTPTEVEECIGLALSKLWYRDRVSITLVDEDNQYNLTTSATWLTDPSQIISLDYRYSQDLIAREVPVVNRKIESDADTVSVTLYDVPSSVDDVTLILTARRWYDALTQDDETTTCPTPLIRAQAKVEILERIFKKLGKSAKENYGMEIILCEKELEKMKARYRQAITPINLVQEEQINQLDVPVTDADWSNWR